MYPSSISLRNSPSLKCGIKSYGESARWYWELNGDSYAELDEELSIDGDFSHEMTGTFSGSSFHLLSDSTGLYRISIIITLDSSLMVNFGVSAASRPVLLSSTEVALLSDGNVHKLKYGRKIGIWFVELDGNAIGQGVGVFNDVIKVNNIGGKWSAVTSITCLTGYSYNHTITTASKVLSIPFNEPFSNNHKFKDSNGKVIGTKYNDVAGDYTKKKPK